MVVAHEYAHAIDCALAEGDGYFSDLNQEIQVAFRDATSFVTPHARIGVDECLAEGMRAMVEVNDNRSPYSRVSRARLSRIDPALYGILARLFDAPGAVAETPAAPRARQHPKARRLRRSAVAIPCRSGDAMGDLKQACPTIDDVQGAIDKLGREDRAMLRPWILARYDVRGERARGFVGPERDAPSDDD
jgi:hypothetical protein